jgi:probable addiction module antidote protein
MTTPKKTVTRPYDAARYLKTEESMAAYLEAALEDGDPKVVTSALGAIARARGMAQIAREAGLSRESLYRALSPEGNPEMATFLKVVRAMGIHLHATATENPAPPGAGRPATAIPPGPPPGLLPIS